MATARSASACLTRHRPPANGHGAGRPIDTSDDRYKHERARIRGSAPVQLVSAGARAGRGYFAVMRKWPRRFCDQQASLSSLQNGASSPLLTIAMRSAGMPRLMR